MTTSTTELPPQPNRVAKELIGSSGFLLARLGFAFKGCAMAKLEAAGFEGSHYGVLAILDEGARETQSTIADALNLDPSRLVALLDSLEERELIARQRDPQDRRRHIVKITPAGKRQLARMRELAKELDDEFFSAALDADERRELHDLLARLAAHVDPRCAFSPSQKTESG